MKKWFLIYLLLFFLGAGLGGQGPGFLGQYAKRVDAHLIEARLNFSGFLIIAQQLHGGSVEALIEHHRKSSDETFKREADVIEGIYKRVTMLEAENNALAGNVFQDAMHVMLKAEKALVEETIKSFTPQLTFNTATISFAVCAGLMLCLIIKLISFLIGLLC